MSIIKPASSFPTLLAGDIINEGLVSWWFGGEGAGTRIANIINSGRFAGAMQAGYTWGVDGYGKTYLGNGGATSYVDCGTVGMLSDTSEFTLAWFETLATNPGAGIYGSLCLFPAGASQRFLVLRSDSSAAYGAMTVGKGSTLNCARWAGAPSLASGVGKTRLWVMSGASISGASFNFSLQVDGINYGASEAGSGNNIGTQTSNLNYLGWDGAVSKFPGSIHNVRLWNRRLSLQESYRLYEDPFAGIAEKRLFKPGAVSTPLYRMFLAQ